MKGSFRGRSGLLAASTALVLLLHPRTSAAQEPERFSLSLFHFNVQYVAGGLLGFPDGETFEPSFELDDAGVRDLIIRESFAPILTLLSGHPSWTPTLEMQAYMVEVMMERHPETLDLL